MLRPSLPHDEAKTDQLAPTHLAEPHHRAAFKTAPLSGVRWPSALGQAVAKGAREAAGAERMIGLT
jgi:hypothetical protein